MYFDLRTLMFAATVANILMGVSMVLLWRTNPTETCLKAWAQGGTFLAVGFMLIWLRGIVSPFWSIPVGNSAIAAGYCLLLVGARLYRGMRISYWPVMATTAGIFLSFLYFTYETPSVNARIVIISIVIGVACLWAAHVLATSIESKSQILEKLAVVVMGLHGTFMLGRSLFTLFQMPIKDFFAANTVTAITLVELLVTSVIFTFMFAILVTRRTVLASQVMKLAVRESEERFTKAFRFSPTAMTISSIDEGVCIDVNDEWLTLTGYTRDEVVCRSAAELDIWPYPDQRDAFTRHIRLDGRFRDLAASLRVKDGDIREVVLSGETVEIGGEASMLLAYHDMTERRQIEERLRHVQKMEAVGQLAGGTAHDFNNILQVVMACLELVGNKIAGDERARKMIDAAIRAARRGGRLTQQLLSFSRRQILSPQFIQPNELIDGMAELLTRTLGGNVVIKVYPEADTPAIYVDQGSLESALLNLAVNARNAMPNGGELIIRTAVKLLNNGIEVEGRTLPAGRYVEISVVDNGHGMPKHVLDRVFEPFFTTREVGEGSGLGLSMVYGFAQQSDGHVILESEVGKGTTVRMLFPVAEGDFEGRREEMIDRPPVEEAAGAVLVVEDDPDVRNSVVAMIEELGYDTREAESAVAALEILERQPSIDLLFTDVIMPGRMGGLELIGEAVRRNRHLKVLVTSGYPENAFEMPNIAGIDVSLLRKPYSVEELEEALRAAQLCLRSNPSSRGMA